MSAPHKSQKCQTTPPPTKKLCWRLFPVSTFSWGMPKKVAHLPAQAEAAEQLYVETCADLENSACGPGLAGVGPENSSEELSLK